LNSRLHGMFMNMSKHDQSPHTAETRPVGTLSITSSYKGQYPKIARWELGRSD
jgi:hypothetical protein